MTQRIWTPRDYQRSLRDFALDNRRVNWWSGPGTGKTSTGIATYDFLRLFGEVQNLLVVSTKRVCKMVWPAEILRWQDFQHLSVAVAVGTVDERLAAIRSKANVTCVNYDVLPWLVATVGEDHWPWDMVIADESSKLKGLRIDMRPSKKTPGKMALRKSGGSERAQRLARVAHKRVQYWINATGTPASNGLQDLFGQMWYIDAGQRLGRTFTAFQQRWFNAIRGSDAHEIIYRPTPFADEQIKAAIRDVTISINAKDYMDLPPTLVNVISVPLPADAYAKYREMEREMFVEIQGEDIEAVNAGSKSMKLRQLCLAHGTKVLCRRGWVRIEQLLHDDLIWDSFGFVSHGGLVDQGVQDLVTLDGVRMTPSHLVMTRDGWKSAQEILNANASQKFERPNVRLPDGTAARRLVESKSDMEAEMRLRERSDPAGRQSYCGSRPKHEAQLRLQTRGEAVTTRHDRQSTTPDMVEHEVALFEPERQGLQKLWREGYTRLQTVGTIVRKFLGRHVRNLQRRADVRSSRQQSRLFKTKLSLGDRKGTRQQYTVQPLARHACRAHDCGSSGRPLRNKARNAVCEANALQLAVAESARTYDILNCGPRNQFVVMGEDGQLLISHNCSGAAYYIPDDGSDTAPWVKVHDAKLDALHDLVSDLNGASLLVAYQFRSDLARLKEAFPTGRYFDDNPKTLADFIAGKFQIMFIHPASGGHGIDGMQEVCQDIAFFSQTWNLEEFEQVIERIGAVRQVSAGFFRDVRVHLLVAENTIEEDMVARLDSKASVQDSLKAAMKRRG